MLRRIGPLALALLVFPGVSNGEAETLDAEKARRVHFDSIVIDTHVDTTPKFEDPGWQFDQRHEQGHVDLPRLREGGQDAVFWSIYMGATPGQGAAVREAVERMDAVHELVRQHPDALMLATRAADIRRAAAEGKIACLMGIEGGHIIEDSLPALRTLHRLGARYLTLTHSFHTAWADSSGTNEIPVPVHGGLAPFGEEVVRELNRLGMMVDISHVSDETFFDAVRVSRAPVIASHSSTRAVADHPRNMSDEMLRVLADNGGVVMINFYSGYVDAALVGPIRALFQRLGPKLGELRERYADDPRARAAAFDRLLAMEEVPTSSLSVLLDHFDHAIRVAGPDHVGIGSDWDGVLSMPRGMEDVSKLPALTQGLLDRGHSEAVVRGILGENLLRVMAEVEAVAAASVQQE